MARILHLARIAVLGLVLLFSIILLGVSAHWENVSRVLKLHVTFADVAIAVSVITIVTVLPMLLVDFFRSGAFTSFIIVELVWFLVLWVLWLATAALTSSNTFASEFFSDGCNFVDDVDDHLAAAANDTCQQWGVLQAFEYLNFILLFVYNIVLLIFAIIGINRGHHIWTNSVRDGEFGAHNGALAAAPAAGPAQNYPMQESHHAPAQGGSVPVSVSHTQGYSGVAQV